MDMRIFVDHGCYDLLNQGDVVMLGVTVNRLRKLWPDADIAVVTDAPQRLLHYCPEARPVLRCGRRAWYTYCHITGRLQGTNRFSRALWGIEQRFWHHQPALAAFWLRARNKLSKRSASAQPLRRYLETIYNADLIVASGGGYITDAFRPIAAEVLDTLSMALLLGKSTAMVGQGLGPVTDRLLWKRVREVLPALDFIAVRESGSAFPLLERLGVRRDRVVMTGDDAIEVAFTARIPEWGRELGVGLRIADYAGTDEHTAALIHPVLQQMVVTHQTLLTPLPTSFYAGDGDVDHVAQLAPLQDDSSYIGGECDHPLRIIERVRRCRVVVTGSYHPAVFALAQGIPVVVLAKSAYYRQKFQGLVDQFGNGCTLLFLGAEQFQEQLFQALNRAWHSAESLRPHLLNVAANLIQEGYAAYRQLYELVELRRNMAKLSSSDFITSLRSERL